MAQYWLYKTEPGTYSLHQLREDKKTNWDQIRNYQARNFLRLAKVGDLVIIYHSGDERAAMGIAKIVKAAYPDVDPQDLKTEWVQVDLEFQSIFKNPVPLSSIKSDAVLNKMLLVKQSRLSAMPIEKNQFEKLVKLGG